MPIKDKSLYPKNWPAIRLEVLQRAKFRCECAGECRRNHGAYGETGFRCREQDGETGRQMNGRVVLTIAHLDHNPRNSRRDNLRAMCQRCHLTYDAGYHAFNAARTRDHKRGQLRFDFPEKFCVRPADRSRSK